MKRVWLPGLATTFLALGAVTAPAQQIFSRPVIAYIEGAVYLDGQRVGASATRVPIKESSVVRTETGLAEILLTPGATLRLGENSSFRMISNRPNDTQIEVLTGSAVVLTDDSAKDINPFHRVLEGRVTVVCENAITLSNFGVYRFDPQVNYCPCVQGGCHGTTCERERCGNDETMNGPCGDHIPVNKFDIGDTDLLDHRSRPASRRFLKRLAYARGSVAEVCSC